MRKHLQAQIQAADAELQRAQRGLQLIGAAATAARNTLNRSQFESWGFWFSEGGFESNRQECDYRY